VLIDGLNLLFEGINVQYIYLPDYVDRTITTLKEPWINALEHIRTDTIGTRDGHVYFVYTHSQRKVL
jgi:hypothetical protein